MIFFSCLFSASFLSLSASPPAPPAPPAPPLPLKSVFEGNLGSGFLKERRDAGLVFCENTSSLYRTLFVSPLALLCFLELRAVA